MPLLSWKKKVKTSNNNVSQFFRDRIQSHRLVVETGFPTVLVDLIVKNRRRRLKRSSEIEVQGRSSSVPDSSLPTPSPPSELRPSSPIHVSDMVDEEKVDTVDKEIKDGENCKGLLMAMQMGAFLVVLALGAKKFAVGLTLSAIALIIVEYLRNHSCFEELIPCSDSTKALKLMMVKILRFMGFNDAKLEGENSGGLKEEMKCESSNSRRITLNHKNPIGDIQSVKIKSLLLDSNDDIVERGIDKSGSDRSLKPRKPDSVAVLLEEAYDLECKKKKTGKAKMKSKWKNVFSKKSSKREKKEGISESNPTLTEENKAVNHLEHRDGNSSSISSGNYNGEEAIETLISESDSESDKVVVVAEVESQKSGNFGYLFLCIIVLIGLYGGRISALLLILTFCLVKKSGGNLRRYTAFLPLIHRQNSGVWRSL